MTTIKDDFSGLVGWRRRSFSLAGRGHVLALQNGHLRLVDRDDNEVFRAPTASIACGTPSGAGLNEGVIRLVVEDRTYDLFGMDLHSMRRVKTARKKIAFAERYQALDMPPEMPDLTEDQYRELTKGINSRIKVAWPLAWLAALRLRGAREL